MVIVVMAITNAIVLKIKIKQAGRPPLWPADSKIIFPSLQQMCTSVPGTYGTYCVGATRSDVE